MRKISISVRNSHKTTFHEKAEVRVLNLNITSIYYQIIRADFAGNMKPMQPEACLCLVLQYWQASL